MLEGMQQVTMAGGGSLLDETLCLWTASLGSADSHKGHDVPAMLAGVGLKHHGRYTHFKQEQPLSKLYLALLQELGVEAERFGEAQQSLALDS